ncbi:CDP-alcohol phosphatidyltransferase family protein [Zafaria sp. Z1313]|uniref:CDP-alcohol phosphatidyltransferase family protein n=1 Tax=unclassified Zafaria TaxID=2828765 RepID=UPI002E77971C|nr:CDP-alcohol phosphatidyltransferase family protein [Zafaria sp. J156]MEE1620055.1 CDP-alcohol phosphatidyltransferase family protein [Zafaria sp. J156]
MRIFGAGHRDDIEYRVLDSFWTVPNVITVGRFLLVPAFVWLGATGQYLAATVVLVVLGSTDWIDGYLARRLNQVSTVGMWLDPLADRLALITVAATFVVTGIAPAWLVYSIVVPDVILIVNSLLLFGGSPGLRVSRLGKTRTALMLVGAPLLLLGRVPGLEESAIGPTATVLLAIACALHIAAAAGYFVKAHQKARARRSGTAWSG